MATPAKRLFRPPRAPARPPHRATSPTYRPRRPTATALYPVVQHHLETFLARATGADPLGNGVPWWVEKDFRARASQQTPPLAPARGPPQRDFLLDQTPSFDPVDPEPALDVLFDQSLPDDVDD